MKNTTQPTNKNIILEEIMHKDVKITGKNGFVLLDIC